MNIKETSQALVPLSVLEIKKKNPGCPYFKSQATKPVDLVALMNPWLSVRKTTHLSALLKKTFIFVFSFLSHTLHLSRSISLSFEEAALHQSKNATFSLCERKYLYSVLLVEDIKKSKPK